MQIIGLAGRKRSGKDTVCALIQKQLANLVVRRTAFADPLKREVCQLLGVGLEDIEADKGRFRGILQWWGTEWRRHQDDRYWINQLDADLQKMRGSVDLVVITDVRFRNEVEYVRSIGGSVVSVVRHVDTGDNHSSENDLNGLTMDYFIDNNGGLLDLEFNVARFIATRKVVSQNLQRVL